MIYDQLNFRKKWENIYIYMYMYIGIYNYCIFVFFYFRQANVNATKQECAYQVSWSGTCLYVLERRLHLKCIIIDWIW